MPSTGRSFSLVLVTVAAVFAREDLTLTDYAGYRTMPATICLGGNSRLITTSYLTGFRYTECLNACRGNYNCAGFAIRQTDGVCFAVSTGCTLRDDTDWSFYRRIGSGTVQIGQPQPPNWVMPIELAVPVIVQQPTTTTTQAPTPRWLSYPEFTYIGSHCQGSPLDSREFTNTDSCRAYCVATPSCFGFSLRFDGLCVPKTSSCRWISDVQWTFYLRAYRAVFVAAPPTTTSTTPAPVVRAQRPLVLVQLVPISSAESGWAAGWPTFTDFYLMNGHCQGGALQQDYLYSAASCRRACLSDSRCYGFSMRSDGLCLPKSSSCSWTNYPVDDWKFYKTRLSSDDSLPIITLVEPSEMPGIACGQSRSPCFTL